MSFVVTCVYIGGVGPFYRRERTRHGRIVAAISALGWPFDLGAALARAAWHLSNPTR